MTQNELWELISDKIWDHAGLDDSGWDVGTATSEIIEMLEEKGIIRTTSDKKVICGVDILV